MIGLKKGGLILAVLLLLSVCVSCGGKRYDTAGLETLFGANGENDDLYWSDGSFAEARQKVVLLEEKNEERELVIRLVMRPRDDGRADYQLMASLHDRTLVSGYIAAFQFTYTFYDDSDMNRHMEMAQVNCFKGEESVETLRQQAFYQVTDLKLKDGLFESCSFRSVTMVGQKKDPDFVLPEADSVYLEELMQRCFAAATDFLTEKGIPPFYE